MRVRVGATIQIETPTPKIIAWCKTNLVIPNPEYAKKARMNLWLGRTPETIALYEIHGDTIVLPYGTLEDVKKLVPDTEYTWIYEKRQPQKISYNAHVPLYDYQKDAVLEMLFAGSGILQSPAGSGKTQMGIALFTMWNSKTLWLTHTIDLLKQSKERAERYIDPDLIGTITEGKVNIGRGVTFATVQTMCRLDLRQYEKEWEVVIVDECHRVAGSPTTITQFYKVLNSLSARHKYGLSATVHRSDGTIKATYALVGNVAYTVPESAVEDKIMKVAVRPCHTFTKITTDCLNTDGTLNFAKLINHLATDKDRTDYIVSYIEANEGHPSLILSDRLEHLERLMNTLPERMRADAVMISGKMTSKSGKADREQALNDMRNGEKKYLFATYQLAKEGLDIPCLDRLYLTTPQKDYAVVTQSIGRIARTCEGKNSPVCYDFIDDAGYLVKMWKKRVTTYNKLGCNFIEG